MEIFRGGLQISYEEGGRLRQVVVCRHGQGFPRASHQVIGEPDGEVTPFSHAYCGAKRPYLPCPVVAERLRCEPYQRLAVGAWRTL